jgi:hypothetical protein
MCGSVKLENLKLVKLKSGLLKIYVFFGTDRNIKALLYQMCELLHRMTAIACARRCLAISAAKLIYIIQMVIAVFELKKVNVNQCQGTVKNHVVASF